MVIIKLIGRWRRYNVNDAVLLLIGKNGCICFLVSILALEPDFFVKYWTERNINISNKGNLLNIY